MDNFQLRNEGKAQDGVNVQILVKILICYVLW